VSLVAADNTMLFNEYKMLRDEILQLISLQNTLVTFTVTSYVILVGSLYSLDSNVYLFLLPFVILIPMITRVAYYRRSLIQKSAYMIVFLEPYIPEINWETRHRDVWKELDKRKKEKFPNRFFTQRNYEFSILGLITTIIFYIRYLENPICITITTVLSLLFPLICLAFIIWVTYKTNRLSATREEWVEEFKKLKEKPQEEHEKQPEE